MIISGNKLIVQAPVFNVPEIKLGLPCKIRATVGGYSGLPRSGKYYNGVVCYSDRDLLKVVVVDRAGDPVVVSVPILQFLDKSIEILLDTETQYDGEKVTPNGD